MNTLIPRPVPIRVDAKPDPNAPERLCRESGHRWSFDRELRCYVCRNCQTLDR